MEEEAGTGGCAAEVADATAVVSLGSANSGCPGADICIDRVTGRLPWEGPDEVGILG
jgi:hypothetical protein